MMIRRTTTGNPVSTTSSNNGTIVSSPLPSTSNKRGRGGILQHQYNQHHAGGRRTPLLVIAVTMSVAIVGMGLMGMYTMLQHVPTQRGTMLVEDGGHTPKLPDVIKHDWLRVSPDQARSILQQITHRFEERYGGEMAHDILAKAVHAFGSIDETGHRIVTAAQEGRPFIMAFSGYSVTVGRGNFFNQSFPFVVRDVLEGPLDSVFGIPLVVRNAAIGGIPSFPYGFCLEHFLGANPDVISWDYSMNEGTKDSSVLEAFLRQASHQLGRGRVGISTDKEEPRRTPPMIVMLDTNPNRMHILDEYTKRGWLRDAIAVGKKEILDEGKIFAMDPLPSGFQDWDEFGAPKTCPGRGAWHPKRQEHAMIGWMIAMHFVRAMERAIQFQENPKLLMEVTERQLLANDRSRSAYTSPRSPNLPDNDAEVTELLYGHLTSSNGNDEYVMKDVSCRTSFLPATDHSKTISSVVVSGLAEGDLDIMVDRTNQHYKEGWVLDVSKVERDTKRKVESCGGLGYIDMKIALYGIPESGKLRLWLPFEGPSHMKHDHDDSEGVAAKHWFDDLLICEANEKRDKEACKLDQDMDVVVGGVSISTIRPVHGAGEYLKRTTCVNIGVPDAATVTRLGDVRTTEGRLLSDEDKKKFGVESDTLGLVVDITAKSKVTRDNGACCLSHVVWEQH